MYSKYLDRFNGLTVTQLEVMTSEDLLEDIKRAIEESQENHGVFVEDVIRALKVKQGLLHSDPANATETLADLGIGYEDTKKKMTTILESLGESFGVDEWAIYGALEKYLDAEEQFARGPSRKAKSIDPFPVVWP